MKGHIAVAACALGVLAAGAYGDADRATWLTWGHGLERQNYSAQAFPGGGLRGWAKKVEGRVTVQPLVAGSRVYIATGRGLVYAFTTGGRLVWKKRLGSIAHRCPQLPHYGITGTPVADEKTGALYAVDAKGWLHALDLASGRELPGWPVRLFEDFRQELVWGALTLVAGAVYAATGSYCDLGPMQGKLIRVSLATREVTSWTAVPARLGGGGGIWGWAGTAYSSERGSLFVATGNAFKGGENTGKRHSEAAGYGIHVVELTPELRVRSANHPKGIRAPKDLDFGGAPVVARPPGCPELLAVPGKDKRLYAWRTAALARGPTWSVGLRAYQKYPLVTQPVYAPPLRSFYLTTGRWLVRITVGRECRGRLAWARRLSRWFANGIPLVAGRTVWLGTFTSRELLAFDGVTGRRVARRVVRGGTYNAPALAGGRLYLATFNGWLYGLRRG